MATGSRNQSNKKTSRNSYLAIRQTKYKKNKMRTMKEKKSQENDKPYLALDPKK